MRPRVRLPRQLARCCRRGLATPKPLGVLQELESRGFVAALTNPHLQRHLESPSCVYAGVDPSASSLHVGNLLPLLTLLHLSHAGHRVVALIGGATGSIGDPSGRSSERKALKAEELEHNVRGITAQVHRFFERGADYAARRQASASRSNSPSEAESSTMAAARQAAELGRVEVLNNLDWFKDVTFLSFLRDVGKLARVNVMLARESVKARLSSAAGISFTEFTYQLLQAYDFLHLYESHGCRVQVGGSDQWGNIVAGIDLIKRVHGRAGAGEVKEDEWGLNQDLGVQDGGGEMDLAKEVEAYGLTIPLLTTASGEKFGKSAGNAVWLDEGRTSVSEFYQFFMRAADEDVASYLKLLTLMPLGEITDLIHAHSRSPKKREAQEVLANEVTELVHGRKAVERAQDTTRILYRTPPRQIKSAEVLRALEGDSRLVRVPWEEVKGVPVTKLAVQYSMVQSRADASRAVRSQSFFVNDRKINDPRSEISRTDLVDGHLAVLKIGSKNQMILYLE